MMGVRNMRVIAAMGSHQAVSRGAADDGFTLVELLIAVFSLALLMTAGGALLLSTLDSRTLVQSRLERLNKLEVMTAHLQTDLLSTIDRPTRSVLAHQDGRSFYGGFPDREDIVLSFVRTGWTNIDREADRSELLLVSYRFDEGQLIRRVHQSPDRARGTPEFETVLLDGIRSLDVRFVDEGLTTSRWAFGNQTEAGLPNAVSIDVVFDTGEILRQQFLVGGAA